jgi:organic radical activating enzyme
MVMDPKRLATCASRDEADLVEIFSSIQGEGPRVGERHLFVRFAHCDIHCAYCDTPLCHRVPAAMRLEQTPGRRDFADVQNPVAVSLLAGLVRDRLRRVRHRAVSFTGGEPLLQPWAIAHVAPTCREEGVPVLLETDGNLPESFSGIRDSIDIVSLDWKLPSATREPPRYEEHRRFLELARAHECYVKAVYVAETPLEELLEAARAVAAIRPDIPFILQPCTPCGRVRAAPPPELAVLFEEALSRVLPDVRVLPQVHHAMGQL